MITLTYSATGDVMAANDRQEGGDHYKIKEYQPWDFITDLGLPYLVGNAVKYVSRWRDKNGVKDLLKAHHYIEKAREDDVYPEQTFQRLTQENSTREYLDQFCKEDAHLLDLILSGHYDAAMGEISMMIEDAHSKMADDAQRKSVKGVRNTTLFNTGKECKETHHKIIWHYMLKANEQFTEPLSIDEVKAVFSSLGFELKGRPCGS